MSRDAKPSSSSAAARSKASVEVVTVGDAALVNVVGLVDERFLGFGDVSGKKCVIVNVAGISRMTSFGVRQWLNGMEALPKTITDLYLLGCPTFFVDQLNMVLNFGGGSKVLTVVAPYTCPACGVESGETIDVLAERANLAKGGLSDKECSRCQGKLEFDESPESYFAFISKYAASSIHPAAAELLAAQRLYTSLGNATEKPPRITKLVHGSVTYFRIAGTIGSMFRARPFLVGAEGEVVIDLAEVDRFDAAGQNEWRRLLKSLAKQVPSVSIVDVNHSILAAAGDTLAMARNIAVASVLVPYACTECGRTTRESAMLDGMVWPLQFPARVCATCGGETRIGLTLETLVPLQKASTSAPPASAKMIAQRDEILSRALTDANVAQAGEGATAAVVADDTILGKYKIVKRLSAGGMAEVFLAKQVGIGGFEKHVALKRIQRKLLDSRHQAIELFLNEAKIAGRLAHPNIVQVLDVGEVQGALYLAMEYVHGKDLRAVVRRLQGNSTAMPLAHACFIIREVAQALHHAYWSMDMGGKRLSVVHRDVSPHNVILSYEGTVKLLDFGVAMSAVTEHAETMIVGKWLYMSPETTANKQIDHRSDLFSLGVILYLLCSGVTPFTGPEPKAIVKKIRGGIYKPLQEVVPDVPPRLAALVDRLLAPNPENRPQRGQEVVTELTEIMRAHGLESTGPDMASFLAHLFPEEVAGSMQQELNRLQEIGRGGADEVGSLTTRERSAVSITPSSVSRSLPAVDVSQTYRWSGSHQATPLPVSAPRNTGSMLPRVSLDRMPPMPLPLPPRRALSPVWIVTLLALLAILAGVGTFVLFSS
ncbi:MAG: serine/threonine protein kinase [Deltaproteobacteria bacterium]|nr:serine/threonine protein kinase [Deltaproteobacteria bacterium]